VFNLRLKRVVGTVLTICLLFNIKVALATEIDDVSTKETGITSEGIENKDDFCTYIDIQNRTGKIDWGSTHIPSYNSECSVEIVMNDNLDKPVCSETTAETFADFSYSEEATNLLITLKCQDIEINRRIDLINGESLKIFTDNITSNGQVEVAYNVLQPSTLMITRGEQSAFYSIDGADSIFIPMEVGDNSIHAYFDGQNLIRYEAYHDVYYDATAPTLIINEKIDGKTVIGERVAISGKVENANLLVINNENVTLSENGEFSHLISLESGENIINVHARNDNGLNTYSLLLVTKSFGFTTNEIILFGIGILLIIMLFAILRRDKKKGSSSNKLLIALTGLAGVFSMVCIAGFIYSLNMDMNGKYLQMAKVSIEKANRILQLPELTLKGIVIFTVVLTLYMFVLDIRYKKSSKNK